MVRVYFCYRTPYLSIGTKDYNLIGIKVLQIRIILFFFIYIEYLNLHSINFDDRPIRLHKYSSSTVEDKSKNTTMYKPKIQRLRRDTPFKRIISINIPKLKNQILILEFTLLALNCHTIAPGRIILFSIGQGRKPFWNLNKRGAILIIQSRTNRKYMAAIWLYYQCNQFVCILRTFTCLFS